MLRVDRSKGVDFKGDHGSSIASKHARKQEARPPKVNEEFGLDSDDFCFICAGVRNAGGYNRNA